MKLWDRINKLNIIITIIAIVLMILPTVITYNLVKRNDAVDEKLDEYVEAQEKTVADENDAASLDDAKELMASDDTHIDGATEDVAASEPDVDINDSSNLADSLIATASDADAEEIDSFVPNGKKVYLTFDDGPSMYTEELLDILDEYNVKATFFVVKNNRRTTQLQHIVKRGHSIGLHSASHVYKWIYSSDMRFQIDVNGVHDWVENITGVDTRLYRFPGGSSNTVSKVDMKELINYLALENITYYDWNVASGDDRDGITKDMIVANVMAGVPKFENSILLLHDASDKKTTVDALPEIIEQISAMEDTVIVPITDDTLPVQHISINSQ